MDAYGGGADEGSDIAGNSTFLQVVKVFSQSSPLDLKTDISLQVTLIGFHCIVERPHRVSFAHHFECHSLPNITLGTAVLDERFCGPTQHIDESGRDGQAAN